jgi:hypothetical protein
MIYSRWVAATFSISATKRLLSFFTKTLTGYIVRPLKIFRYSSFASLTISQFQPPAGEAWRYAPMNEIRGVYMSFYKEPTHYEKTALSDLQGAWTILRDTVVENFGFPGSDKIIFHIDEAMSWECVRDLNRMYPLINLIHNLANQHEAPESIIESIIEVRRNFEEVRTAFIKGETD